MTFSISSENAGGYDTKYVINGGTRNYDNSESTSDDSISIVGVTSAFAGGGGVGWGRGIRAVKLSFDR